MNQLTEKMGVRFRALTQVCVLSAEEANLGRLDVTTLLLRISTHLAPSLTETDIRVLSKFEMNYRDASIMFYPTAQL